MVVDIKIVGPGGFVGANKAINSLSSYSVSEESTPIDASDTSGAVGQISLNVIENPNSVTLGPLLINNTITMSDSYRGVTLGTVTGLSSSDGALAITATSRLGKLVATRKANPFNGTLGDALRYYLSLGEITTNYVIDASLESIPVVFPGWNGDVWTMLKNLCPLYGFEISLVSANIVFRPIRTREVLTTKDTARSWTVQNSDLARAVEAYYYTNTYITNSLVYPYGGWNDDVQVLSLEAAEVKDFEIPVTVSLSSVQQPTYVSYVSRGYVGPSSVYTAVGSDNLPITPAQWAAGGGSMSVRIGEDTKTLIISVTAPGESKYSPYRIAVSAGSSDTYSSLRLVGSGGAFVPDNKVTVRTGIEDSRTPTTVGVTIENIFVSSYQQALTVAGVAAIRYGSPQQQISVNASAVNKRGDSGDASYPTVAYWESLFAGKTVGFVDNFYASQSYTIQMISDNLYLQTQDTFTNQAYGNVTGARLTGGIVNYRIRGANFTESEINYNAERDTTVGDMQTRFTGVTCAQVDAAYSARTIEQIMVSSLG